MIVNVDVDEEDEVDVCVREEVPVDDNEPLADMELELVGVIVNVDVEDDDEVELRVRVRVPLDDDDALADPEGVLDTVSEPVPDGV